MEPLLNEVEFDDDDHIAEFGGIKKAYKKFKEKKEKEKEKEREKEEEEEKEKIEKIEKIEKEKHEREMNEEGEELMKLYDKEKNAPRRIKFNLSEKSQDSAMEKIYDCFIIRGENNKIKITGYKQNSYDIVQAGYKGVKIDDYDHLNGKERYYLVYSKRDFAASNILLLASSISVENTIDEFYDNFPIIVKCMDYQFTESAFMSVFLSIMYSIKNHRDASEEDRIKIMDSVTQL